MYPAIDDDDLLAALCFDQSNGPEDRYPNLQTDPEDIFLNFESSGVNLQREQEEFCNIGAQFDLFSGNLPQQPQSLSSVNGDSNLRPYDVVFNSSSIGSQVDLASYSGFLSQEPHQVCSIGGLNDSAPHCGGIVQQEPEQVCSDVVEINSSSSVGTVKQEEEHMEEECSRKRWRAGSCSKSGTKACREKLRREKLNDKFMDLSSVLEPARTPKTDKAAILDDAIRVVNQLRAEANELKETNQKLLKEIKSLKVEKNELREEKLVLKADKEKIEQQIKSMAVPSPGFMPSHPAAFYPNKMAVYPGYSYFPNMPMWPYLHPLDCDTSHDHLKRPPAA